MPSGLRCHGIPPATPGASGRCSAGSGRCPRSAAAMPPCAAVCGSTSWSHRRTAMPRTVTAPRATMTTISQNHPGLCRGCTPPVGVGREVTRSRSRGALGTHGTGGAAVPDRVGAAPSRKRTSGPAPALRALAPRPSGPPAARWSPASARGPRSLFAMAGRPCGFGDRVPLPTTGSPRAGDGRDEARLWNPCREMRADARGASVAARRGWGAMPSPIRVLAAPRADVREVGSSGGAGARGPAAGAVPPPEKRSRAAATRSRAAGTVRAGRTREEGSGRRGAGAPAVSGERRRSGRVRPG